MVTHWAVTCSKWLPSLEFRRQVLYGCFLPVAHGLLPALVPVILDCGFFSVCAPFQSPLYYPTGRTWDRFDVSALSCPSCVVSARLPVLTRVRSRCCLVRVSPPAPHSGCKRQSPCRLPSASPHSLHGLDSSGACAMPGVWGAPPWTRCPEGLPVLVASHPCPPRGTPVSRVAEEVWRCRDRVEARSPLSESY